MPNGGLWALPSCEVHTEALLPPLQGIGWLFPQNTPVKWPCTSTDAGDTNTTPTRTQYGSTSCGHASFTPSSNLFNTNGPSFHSSNCARAGVSGEATTSRPSA